jgi:transcriptional regulator with XRE-family HTH domain
MKKSLEGGGVDLEKLGAEMKQRRKALGMPGALVARRIGVSPSYLWMIESAKPRANGEPSKPSAKLMQLWAHALSLDEEGTQYVMGLAGHGGQEIAEETKRQGGATVLTEEQQRRRAVREQFLGQPRGMVTSGLTSRLGRTLEEAANLDEDTWDDVISSAGSMIDWMGFKVWRARVEHERAEDEGERSK